MWTSYGNKSKNCILKSARRSLAIVRKCQERLETLCAIEEREKIKIKMKRICKVWPTGESRALPTLTREKPWTNINGPSCGRGRGGGSTKRARESIIAYKIAPNNSVINSEESEEDLSRTNMIFFFLNCWH